MEKADTDTADVTAGGPRGQTSSSTTYMVIKTIFMVLAPLVMGIYLELAGPTLPDLQEQVGANYEEISRALVARSVGYLVSSLVSGVLVDRFKGHRELVLAIAFLLGGTGTLFTPWTGYLWALGLLFFLQGLGQGSIDTSNNAICISMWAERAAAPIHALHFGFGIGAFIAPQLARPFVSPSDPEAANATAANASHPTVNASDPTAPPALPRLEVPYAISAILAYAFFFIFLGFYIHERRLARRSFDVNPEEKADKEVRLKERLKGLFSPGSCTGGDVVFGIQFFILIFLFYFNIVGGERACSKFIYSYAVDSEAAMSTDDAATLNSVYWIAFTCGRGLTIIIARWVAPHILLFIEMAVNIACGVALAVWAEDNTVVLWVFTGLLGLFMAPVFPGGLSLANRYVLMNGTAVAVVFVGSSVGGMVYQWMTGYLFEYHGPHALMYVVCGFAVSLAAIYVMLYLLVCRRPLRFQDASDSDSESDIKGYQDTVDVETVGTTSRSHWRDHTDDEMRKRNVKSASCGDVSFETGRDDVLELTDINL